MNLKSESYIFEFQRSLTNRVKKKNQADQRDIRWHEWHADTARYTKGSVPCFSATPYNYEYRRHSPTLQMHRSNLFDLELQQSNLSNYSIHLRTDTPL